MSKSEGNVIDPLVMIKEMGADILRLWVSSADYRNDVSVSNNIIRQCAEAYRKIRNTCRFIISNLYDFDPDTNQVDYADMEDLDRWALLKLDKLVRRVTAAYEDYEFHVVFHSIHNFCTVDMSNIYLDILKDKLYCSLPGSRERRATQTVFHKIINALVVMLTPVLAFTSEELWTHLRRPGQVESVQMLTWPAADDSFQDEALEKRMDRLLQAREVVTKALEEARVRKIIGHSLGARVALYADYGWDEILPEAEELARIFIVSRVEVETSDKKPADALALEEVPGLWVAVQAAEGGKCERCWIIETTVGEDEQHPCLCQRCAGVVKELPIQQ